MSAYFRSRYFPYDFRDFWRFRIRLRTFHWFTSLNSAANSERLGGKIALSINLIRASSHFPPEILRFSVIIFPITRQALNFVSPAKSFHLQCLDYLIISALLPPPNCFCLQFIFHIYHRHVCLCWHPFILFPLLILFDISSTIS